MKKSFLISALLLALAGVAMGGYWMLREPEMGWSTRSPKALAEFKQGFDAMSKLYSAEAVEHFAKAVELDPGFTIAKLSLARFEDKDERQRLRTELEAADRGRLNPQERFLLDYWLAREDPALRGGSGEAHGAEAKAILEAFLADYPRNFFGLMERCDVDWGDQSWSDAEACYQRLIELHPNWVQAQNRLGYIAMARGRFSEAEEKFRIYRFIAPDQANPYDSMAELLILLGRYEEAEASLREALRIKPDFCHAYLLRAQLGIFSGELDRTAEALRAMASFEACDRGPAFDCSMRTTVSYLRGDVEKATRLLDGECPEQDGFELIVHRVAVMTGRLEQALEMEENLRRYRDQAEAEGRSAADGLIGSRLAHMAGIRALAKSDYSTAIDSLSQADELTGYWGGDRVSFKLFNRLNLLRALELGDETARAEALRRKIDAINPRIVDEFPLKDLEAPS